MVKLRDSPCMSDNTLLVSVEDLISMAMGPPNVNKVNFKMIQTVLHILARQLRLLKTQVEIKVDEAPLQMQKTTTESLSSDSSSSSPRNESSPPKDHLKAIKEEKGRPSRDREKEDRKFAKDKERAEKAALKEKEKEGKLSAKERDKASKDQERAEKATAKEKDKAERAESKEREKADRAASKEKEKAGRAESKERDKAERAESKEKEKAERAASRGRDKADTAESKEREKAEKTTIKEKKGESKDKDKAERAESKDREKAEKSALKEQEKAERAESKERDKADKSESKEREKAEKAASKDKEKAEKLSGKEREKAEKEREKLEKMDAKDREKAEKEREKLDKMDAKDREKAEKEREKLDKMDAKEREKAEKEREKLEKMDAKEREKAEKEREKLEKMDAKEREKAEKEREKFEKMDAKERQRAEKEKEKVEAKEKEKLEKMGAKEKAKYLKEKERAQAESKEKTGISVKERQKDRVLIVEKGPTTRTDSKTRVGSIEVVTLSQFEMLEAAVKELSDKAGPVPFPAMPDNQELRTQLAKGSASLTDTMQAMQVAARVQAAETAIDRMAGLLTQLAAAGALPGDVADQLEDVRAEMDAIADESGRSRPVAPSAGRKSVAIDPMSKKASTATRMEAKPSSVPPRSSAISRASVASRASTGAPCVTHIEMDDAIRSLKDDLTKNVNSSTMRATAAAESAAAVAKAVSDKLDIALKLNSRINSLYSLVADYAEQLSGFDAGLTTQMQSFQEQMAQMRSDLKGGMAQLETANNNAETAAVMELTERYEGLVLELDRTMEAHTALAAFQNQLGDELRSLLECVEMLREQKADRDEVQDGLRDKADISRLAGLMSEAEFALSRAELERRLECCYDKFRKQEQVWIGALKDLSLVAEGKAEIVELLAAKDDAQQQLRDIQERLQKLAVLLGEPKAAMLARQLSRGGHCGACQVPALQEPFDINYGKPFPLPALRPPPAGEENPCMPEWQPPRPPDDREHACHRWVGGSHTLLAESVVREQAPPLQIFGIPTKKYAGYGSDGRLYMMEEERQPCAECNLVSMGDKIQETQPVGASQGNGAGDTGLNPADIERAP